MLVPRYVSFSIISTIISIQSYLFLYPNSIYKKWNERLFHEAYVSYEAGRSKKDPSKGMFPYVVVEFPKKVGDYI